MDTEILKLQFGVLTNKLGVLNKCVQLKSFIYFKTMSLCEYVCQNIVTVSLYILCILFHDST